MTEKQYKIQGMNCMHCVMAVKKELAKAGLESFAVEIGSANVKFDETKIEFSAIEKAIVEAGFQIEK